MLTIMTTFKILKMKMFLALSLSDVVHILSMLINVKIPTGVFLKHVFISFLESGAHVGCST